MDLSHDRWYNSNIMGAENKELNDSGLESAYKPGLKISDELISLVEAAPRGEEITYGATPYDDIISLSNQQDVLANRQILLGLIRIGFPSFISQYVQKTFNARFWARLAANDENFSTRLLHENLDEVDLRLRPMIDRGRIGKASPAELMLIRDQLGIRSLEVACLTHPYGDNIKEQLPQMRESVRAAVEVLGGTFDETPQPRYAVKEVLRDEAGKPVAVLMTRKRDVGVVPNGTDDSTAIVRERSSFIVRIDDESRFKQLHYDENIIDTFANIADQDKATQKESLEHFTSTIEMFINFDVFAEAIPLATTTYVFDRRTTAMVEQYAVSHPKTLQAEEEFFAKSPQEGAVNEVQERLEQITKAYQNAVYQQGMLPKNSPLFED
jgi:hypothetical protein